MWFFSSSKKETPAATTSSFNEQAAPPAPQHIRIGHNAGTDQITIKNLTVQLQKGETLVSDFSFTLSPGDRLVLTGPSGCGKSTLLKAMSGLWPVGEGSITWPKDANVLSIPQKPYLPQTDLAGILNYPQPAGTYSREEMEEALNRVHHTRLIDKLDDHETDGASYSRQLSLGEQQRLVFARILLHKPDILLLDEVTASLDVTSGNEMYDLITTGLPNAIIISVAHQASVIPFHTLHARVENKTVTVAPIAPEAKESPAQKPATGPQPS